MADFEVNDSGSITQIIPTSEEAKEWIDENVETEGWQWMGGALCVETRYAGDLIFAMEDAGLIGEQA